jgi:class 3 adenylate cyclase/DNA-binding SARP family transcriptional activator
LCELLLVSPGHRIRRDLACEALFGHRDQRTASRALSKALSMARAALTGLGEAGGSLLAADRTHIWVAGPVEIDAEAEEEALAGALAMMAGNDRTRRLRAVLSGATAGDELLADEPDEEWARGPRERLAALRQEARLALARDLAPAGIQDEVLAAWQSCLDHDPGCEEAAGALARAYLARHRPEQAARVLQRCRVALEELGLRLSPSLESAYAAAVSPPASPAPVPAVPVQPFPVQPLSAQPAVGRAGPREERRPVSVLFAEVAAPAGTAATRDLEALRESVGGVLAVVITEVEALGGLVTSVSGRGLEALFGVPAAHEDDPERAVRAAFRAVARTSPATVLRIGVESGPAVVGPAVGGTGTTYTAFGEVVNLAAALQSAARPGSVLVGPATRAAAGHLFAWDAPEKVILDPGTERVVASYLDAPRAQAGERRAALGGTAPLAGREEPMRVLSGALRELAGGRGSVVVLTGEPGLGKTRLVQEARARFIAWAGAGTGRIPQWVEARCTSYTSDTPYGLYRELLASWTGTSPDERPAIRLLALEQALQRLMGNLNLLPSLARMAGLPATADQASATRAKARSGQTQQMIFGAMRALVTRLVAVAPTVLVLEDLHWSDQTSLHLSWHLAELARDRPLLILATARTGPPHDGPPVTATVRRVRLRPLAPAAARTLATSLIGEAAENVLDAVVSPAEGNPLFLEERLTALLDSRTLVRDQGEWWLRDTADPQLSQVLERLVRSRVDRLSLAAQEAVRAASVLGFEFQTAQLAAMLNAAPLPDMDGSPAGDPVPAGDLGRSLDPVLSELVASDLIHHRQPRGPQRAFVFRHALIQEATYLGLLRAERRAWHARAAAAIEVSVQGRSPEAAAVLGRHYARAGDDQRAVRYLEIAGDHATDAFANDEAISSFRAALELATGPGAAAVGPDTVVRLYAKLANVLWRTARHGETRQAFQDALAVAESATVVSALRRAWLYTRLGRVNLPDSRFDAAAVAFDAAEALLGADAGSGPDGDSASGDRAIVDQWLELMIDGRASMYGMLGDLDRAEAVLERARPLLEAHGTPARKTEYYRRVVLQGLARNGKRPSGGDIELSRRSLVFARQTGEDKDVAYAAHGLAFVLALHGDLAEARRNAELAVDTADRVGESFLLPAALTGLAVIALRQGDTGTARSTLDRVRAVASESGPGTSGPGTDGTGRWGEAAMILNAWLDRSRDGHGRGEAGPADELAAFLGGRASASEQWLAPLLHLVRGLR